MDESYPVDAQGVPLGADRHPLDAERHSLDAQMLDAITEAVVTPEDPKTRAEVISELVHEIDEVVKWRHEPGVGESELKSLETVVEAATRHVERMTEVSHEG